MHEKKLDLSKRKKKIKESLLMQFIRLWSYPITHILIRTPITANQVTFLSFIFVVLASVSFSLNEYRFTLLGGIFAWIAIILDLADGEIARIKNQCSDFGRWFDGALDRVKDFLILAGISIGVYQQYPSIYILILGLFATASTALWRYLSLFKIAIFNLPLEKEKPYKLIGLDVGMQYFIITVGALLNQLLLVLIFFAVFINLAWLKNIFITFIRRNDRGGASK
ncbi:MAG: CDP-alcohol phosphatidyltransferase family protein [Nanoarchaeota archaeon]|nr:CDP-alcohol phosphatidyltransferase family protein [Nanoarchaeota archaeon]MCG2717781.1 CDP-alcohol phosphatidyltransferase family protein [Nanoarchaeota archaeon]